MAKFDIYPDPAGKGFLLDVQTDLLDGLNTRAVIPLRRPKNAPRPARWLNPTFTVGGVDHVLVTQYIAAVPMTILKSPVDNLRHHFAAITAAIDMLIQGF